MDRQAILIEKLSEEGMLTREEFHELIKGRMDDVFLAVTGSSLPGGK